MKAFSPAPYGHVQTQHGWASIIRVRPGKLLTQDNQLMVGIYRGQSLPISHFSQDEQNRLKQARFDY